jgi:hypothetical protein
MPPAAGAEARLINVASRAASRGGDAVLIAGFVLEGTERATVLLRGVGPGLREAPFEIAGLLGEPRSSLFAGESLLRTNVLGGGEAAVVAAAVEAGAYRFANSAGDAALVAELEPGAYTVQVDSAGGGTGVALAEVYLVGASAGVRLRNLSTRAVVGDGAEAVIPGFVVRGPAAQRFLIRAVGPGLAAFGVAAESVLPRPRLTVRRGEAVVAENVIWDSTSANAEAVAAANGGAGAFALVAGSADAAAGGRVAAGGLYRAGGGRRRARWSGARRCVFVAVKGAGNAAARAQKGAVGTRHLGARTGLGEAGYIWVGLLRRSGI